MRVQWEILLFMVCLNLAIGLCISLSVAGTAYISPTGLIDSDEYEDHFNPDDVAVWGKNASPFLGIPVIGDIWAGFGFLWQMIGFLVDGTPTLIMWIGQSFITTSDALLVFNIIANSLRAVQAILVSLFLVEFISGRNFTD